MTHRFVIQKKVPELIRKLREGTKGMNEPMSFLIVSHFGRNPFLVLISGLLSSRTKDTTSFLASLRLFAFATDPAAMLALPLSVIEKAIYPVGFYRQKAIRIKKLCAQLLSDCNGVVPADRNALMNFPGIGPKIANLVLGEGFGIPALCVDVHVHRISNRLGLVATQTPQETELALKAIVPIEYWIELNRLFVMWGQNICVPVSPFCSSCAIKELCERKGITTSR